jgi:hypothetical protein
MMNLAQRMARRSPLFDMVDIQRFRAREVYMRSMGEDRKVSFPTS